MNEKLALIANEIIEYSDGSFNIEWTEEYEALSFEEQQKVADAVYEAIGNCNDCGWHFVWDSMEQHSDGESYCWRCYEDITAEEDEE